MENKNDNKAVGVILILFGLLWASKAIRLFDFDIFFDGWWTLFILIPCGLGLMRRQSKGANIFGVVMGLLLLMWRQGVIPFSYIPAILIAMVFILIGISIMIGKPTHTQSSNQWSGQTFEYGTSSTDSQQRHWQHDEEVKEEEFKFEKQERYHTFETCPPSISAFLVGKSVSCLNGIFQGTNIQSVLGNVQLDLRQAQLENDVYVRVNLVLGGVDIYLPDNARVVCNTQNILGDVRDVRGSKRVDSPNEPAIHIVGTCILGGLEMK